MTNWANVALVNDFVGGGCRVGGAKTDVTSCAQLTEERVGGVRSRRARLTGLLEVNARSGIIATDVAVGAQKWDLGLGGAVGSVPAKSREGGKRWAVVTSRAFSGRRRISRAVVTSWAVVRVLRAKGAEGTLRASLIPRRGRRTTVVSNRARRTSGSINGTSIRLGLERSARTRVGLRLTRGTVVTWWRRIHFGGRHRFNWAIPTSLARTAPANVGGEHLGVEGTNRAGNQPKRSTDVARAVVARRAINWDNGSFNAVVAWAAR
jgi:hypothetical protein